VVLESCTLSAPSVPNATASRRDGDIERLACTGVSFDRSRDTKSRVTPAALCACLGFPSASNPPFEA
jgi:hypothetical protein